jgi:hypothetical protein
MEEDRLYTTLCLMRQYQVCQEEWYNLLAEGGEDEPISLPRVLEIAGLETALRALQAVPAHQADARDRFARLVAANFAERAVVAYETTVPCPDPRPRAAVDVARRYARRQATWDDLLAAYDAALDAACDADEIVPWAAAWSAAHAAAPTPEHEAPRGAAVAARAGLQGPAEREERAWQAARFRALWSTTGRWRGEAASE